MFYVKREHVFHQLTIQYVVKVSTGRFLTCPTESCPAISSVFGQVTVSDSDDSPHLTETNIMTSDPVQFRWGTFHF